MPYLRTNYRITGKELDADAIGRVLLNLSAGADQMSGAKYAGGLMFFSWAFDRPPTTSGVIPVSAYGAMCQTYGPTITSGIFGSGFRIGWVMAYVKPSVGGPGTATASCYKYVVIPTDSYSTSIALISALHGSTGSTAAVLICTESIAFTLFGFIMSTPWS